jgi:hypothetical protein
MYKAQTAPHAIKNPRFALVIGAAPDESNFSLYREVKLPGFSLRPPAPIKAIVVDIGGYEVEVSGLDVGGLTVSSVVPNWMSQ